MNKSKPQIRVFGSENCPVCNEICQQLDSLGYSYNLFDALDEKNEELCDQNEVYELPHIQIIDCAGSIIFEDWGAKVDVKVVDIMAKSLE